ncbi:hypothetical protein C5S31_02160 [ANME-1 cluster archaeon GoMg2]|nr:hypothetical protein [ANME-1 cluster archaeon GoMg2]
MDGGYILTGITKYSASNSDVWLVKTKPNGDKQWEQPFGGSGLDSASSVKQISDGYIIAGTTFSDGAGLSDFWLLKTNSKGEWQWDKTFGGSDQDWAHSVQQTSDNGFIIAGGTFSDGGGYSNALLVKTNLKGDKEWKKPFGGVAADDEAYSVQQTSDKGYILAGRTKSYGAGSWDAWLLKADSSGNEVWNMTFGDKHDEEARAVLQLDDGYILVGTTTSYGAGRSDVWLIKTDSSGHDEWSKTFGHTNYDEGYSVQQTSDDCYILAGRTMSYGNGSWDAWLLKTNSNGDEQWNKTFGGTGADGAYSVQQTTDRGYILAGDTGSFGDASGDFWLIKVRAEGEGNQAPTLSSGSVSPSTGDSTTTFNYYVTYTDSDGDAPTTKYVYIDDTPHTMTETSSSYTTGATFTYSTTLSAESHNYYFYFDDGHGHGTRLPASETYSGPSVSGSHQIFDTGQGTYPSCSGTHEGEITPAHDLKVTKLYTYPCAGTGGHTESIEIREGSKLIASGTWDGYQSDWHNITLHNVTDAPYVTLSKDLKYNYVIRTGSYPQIIHAQNRTTDEGIIECSEFVDANGKRYDDWIPAIRLV